MHQSPSEKGSTLKGTNVLLVGVDSFLSFRNGGGGCGGGAGGNQFVRAAFPSPKII